MDLLLSTEVVTSLENMQALRKALDDLGDFPVPDVEYLQFVKSMGASQVKVDRLTGPIAGEYQKLLIMNPPRVWPRGDVQLHAYLTKEAIGTDDGAILIELPESTKRAINAICVDALLFDV